MQLVLIKALFALIYEFSRVEWLFAYRSFRFSEWSNGDSVSAREKFFTPIWDDGIVSFLSANIYPGFLFIMLVGLTYAVMVPFMNLVTTVYFALAFVIYKHHCLYVFIAPSESGGMLFSPLYNYVLTGLSFATATMAGYMFIKGGALQFLLLLFIFPVIEGYRGRTKQYLSRVGRLGQKQSVALDREIELNRKAGMASQFQAGLFYQPELNFEPLVPKFSSDSLYNKALGAVVDMASVSVELADPSVSPKQHT